jgi:eukaryotic-like serine/threonine-protein kinase
MAEDFLDPVENLFHQAADLPAQEQQAFLDAACPDNPALRALVAKLLADDARLRAGDGRAAILDSPLVRSQPVSSAGQAAGLPSMPSRIGRFRILRTLGEGGMGVVYEAEQDQPRRLVALKVIRPRLVSPALLTRFSHEADILGRLHHPGIAQIYEAGVGEDGQPFFALELIRGQPLDEYVRRGSLTVAARLDLLAQVCDAVQHAHKQGVIHRDLKPGNILVDESGQPWVLDFGVARVTGADLLTTTDRTRTGQLVGTLSYMSPEQVAADPAALDQRSDVYTLGVILFELLAGRLPYPLKDLPLPEAARLICEQEPSHLGSIDTQLRGDVETIVAKALEKERGRRYASAAELAADIRRHLRSEPIRARPSSALYHLRKFARRHKALVGGVAATGMALILGLVGTVLFAVGEARQRGQAEQSAQQAIDEKREALFRTYRARIAAAVSALSVHDVADAGRQLDAAPEELRDWEWRHLRSRLDDSSTVIPVPAQGRGLLLGAPGRLRAGARIAGGVRVTDLESGEGKTVPIGPEHGRSFTVAQTRRGLRVATWVGKTTFDLLDEAGRVLCCVELPGAQEPGFVAVSPDGTRLAVSLREGEWTRSVVFDATSGKQTAVCEGHRASLWALTFSPDGTRLATGGEDNTARLWDPATGSLLATCRGHASKVLGAAFSPDGARLVTTSADGTVRQWDVATGREVEPPYDRHTGEVSAAAYSPDGQWVASAGTDRTVRVWRATGREDVAVLHGHTGGVTEVAFSPDGRRLASLSQEGGFGWAGDNTVRIWEVEPGATLPVLRGHTSYVYPVAFSPDDRWLASGGWDKTVRLWDAMTGELCATLRHPGIVRALAYGPDGRWLASTSDGDNRIRIWDGATERVRKKIQARARYIRSLLVSPGGRRMAVTAWDEDAEKHHLRVSDVASDEQVFSADGGALAYSLDGRWLAVRAADDKTVLLLDAQSYEVAANGPMSNARLPCDLGRSHAVSSAGMRRFGGAWCVDRGLRRAPDTGDTLVPRIVCPVSIVSFALGVARNCGVG